MLGIRESCHLLRPTQGNAKQSLGPHLRDVHSHEICPTRKELAKQKKASERNHLRLK